MLLCGVLLAGALSCADISIDYQNRTVSIDCESYRLCDGVNGFPEGALDELCTFVHGEYASLEIEGLALKQIMIEGLSLRSAHHCKF